MSFTTHPYREMSVAIDQYGLFHWVCKSCGGRSDAYATTTPLSDIFWLWLRHVKESHNLTEEDCQGWTHEFSGEETMAAVQCDGTVSCKAKSHRADCDSQKVQPR